MERFNCSFKLDTGKSQQLKNICLQQIKRNPSMHYSLLMATVQVQITLQIILLVVPSHLSYHMVAEMEAWWHGPKWLNHDSDAWPTKDFPSHSQTSVEVESRKTESRSFYVATTEPIIDISRYSSYTKLLRVTAWILRFVHNCKSQLLIIHKLNCNEIEKAQDY
ncbi:uncharacterized protein TNCT_493431 [Trichonephila clavata]|uniref:Uncharacterized protein n=1 Tax=Trichonephila clavata TaxID=2740835 RepID=A0A8X6I364_TRICU|nr:uncharacterized protein TNCT_493431 [Trichonephila clavata]